MKSKNIIIINLIRLLMLLTIIILVVAVSMTWFLGGELLEDLLDEKLPEVIHTWQYISGFIIMMLPVASLAFGFYWVNRFFTSYQSTKTPSLSLAKAVKYFGWSQIWFWIFNTFMNVVGPKLVFNIDEIELPIGPENIFIVNGLVLLVISKIIYESNKIHQENKDFI